MITLITGGSKNGKSHIAEDILSDCNGNKYYIATMEPYCDDALEAIARHRAIRRDKGFITIERYRDIGGVDIPRGSNVLLECLPNLCANEMFIGGSVSDPCDKIFTGIRSLAERCGELVIVTNEVGCDAVAYTDETDSYIEALSRLNRMVADISGRVIEAVFGIAVTLKGERSC